MTRTRFFGNEKSRTNFKLRQHYPATAFDRAIGGDDDQARNTGNKWRG
jgi:hypothetical protein